MPERGLLGPEEVSRFFEQEIFGTFPDWRTDPVDFLQADDGVFVVLLSGRGTGRGSQAGTGVDLAEVWMLREGIPVRVAGFRLPYRHARRAGLGSADSSTAMNSPSAPYQR